MKDGPTTIEESLKALRNLGVTPNDYDSAALDMVLEWIEDRIANVAPEESSTQHRLLCTKDHTLPGVVFRDIVRNDSYLAKVWHANLTEMAISAGAPPEAAAERASDFMRHTFLVEVS